MDLCCHTVPAMNEIVHTKGWTFFPTYRFNGRYWEGAVAVRYSDVRMEHVCIDEHLHPADALDDAINDALVMAAIV